MSVCAILHLVVRVNQSGYRELNNLWKFNECSGWAEIRSGILYVYYDTTIVQIHAVIHSYLVLLEDWAIL